MKIIFILLYLFMTSPIHSQSPGKPSGDSMIKLSVKFDKHKATKDGYYVGKGYVLEIDAKQAEKLHGKKIKITGHLLLVKGLDEEPKEYDDHGKEIIKQGRASTTSHIINPVIEVIH